MLANRGLTALPSDVCKERGPSVEWLDVSRNRLLCVASRRGRGRAARCSPGGAAHSSLRRLVHFPKLQTLVLDHNHLSGLPDCPIIPVHTLWINNNDVRARARHGRARPRPDGQLTHRRFWTWKSSWTTW